MPRKRKSPIPPTRQGVIAVVPLGKVAEDIARIVSDGLQGILMVPVDLLEAVPLPSGTFMENRQQFNAMAILQYLRENPGSSHLKTLAVTEKDLGNPIVTFVFGQALVGGPGAVISTYRLSRGPDERLVSREHFLQRVMKVALHEIGHAFNLPHCHIGRCVMRASNTLAELDEKLGYLCTYCELFFRDALRAAMQSIGKEHPKS